MERILGLVLCLMGLGFASWIWAQSYVNKAILQDRLTQTEKLLERTETEYNGYQMGVKDSQ